MSVIGQFLKIYLILNPFFALSKFGLDLDSQQMIRIRITSERFDHIFNVLPYFVACTWTTEETGAKIFSGGRSTSTIWCSCHGSSFLDPDSVGSQEL